jgi:ribonuclease HI
VLGDQPEPILTFHARVGGPLATTRAEAASILKLLQDVRMHKGHGVNLLVFIDCLVVLDILSKWGRTDFYPDGGPDPKEVVHFDVIRNLLMELRQWSGNVTLVKIKSHTGCLMNERADAQAELCRKAEEPDGGDLPGAPKVWILLVASEACCSKSRREQWQAAP